LIDLETTEDDMEYDMIKNRFLPITVFVLVAVTSGIAGAQNADTSDQLPSAQKEDRDAPEDSAENGVSDETSTAAPVLEEGAVKDADVLVGSGDTVVSEPMPLEGEPATDQTGASSEKDTGSRVAGGEDASLEIGKKNTGDSREMSPGSVIATKGTDKERRTRKTVFPGERDGLFRLYGALQATWWNDRGYNLFTASEYAGTPAVGIDVDAIRIRKKLVVSFGAQWSREEFESKNIMGGTFNSYWRADEIVLTAMVRFRMFSWMAPYAHAGAGVCLSYARLKDLELNKKYFMDLSGSFAGVAGLGLAFQIPPWQLRRGHVFPTLSAGVSIDGGLRFGPGIPASFDFSTDGAHPIELYTDSPGDLSRTAPYLRATAFVRF